MARKTSTKKGRRKTIQRPVLQFRVSEALYKDLGASAKEHRFTISKEAEHRIQLSFDWETTRLEMQRLTSTVAGVEELMRSHGFQRFPLDNEKVVWVPPGMDISRMSVSLDAAAIYKAMEPEFPAMLARAINKVKPGGDK